jgi:uncharacterized linocin/CFP29 family protein
MANNLGRDKLPWESNLWDRIDQAVNKEGERIRIARRFIPLVPMPDALTTPADTINTDTTFLRVDEGSTVPLIEIWVEFALTKQQVEAEDHLATAVTLATRATNLLAQAEDTLIFQGQAAIDNSKIFKDGTVHYRAGPAGPGLLNNAPPNEFRPSPQSDEGSGNGYGEQTFKAVTKAYSDLQEAGHYGPYALAFHTDIYADTYAPLEKTLIMPADRIKPLMDKGFFGTGTLPELTGLLLSIGGNTVDLVIGKDAITAFMQEDGEGLYRFRVFERFAVRDKDAKGRVKLGFQAGEDKKKSVAAPK